MEVMGPERILPNSEEELGHDRPSDGLGVPEWSGEDIEEDEAGAVDEDDEDNGGYYYQPLNQDPDGMLPVPTEQPDETASPAEQIQEVQDRIEVRVIGRSHHLIHSHSVSPWFASPTLHKSAVDQSFKLTMCITRHVSTMENGHF